MAHQVEVARWGRAGVGAIVHAQEAYHFEGNGSHGHECGELHAPAHEAALQATGVHLRQPVAAHHRQGHGAVELSQLAVVQPLLQGHQDSIEQALAGVIARLEKPRHQSLQQLYPLGGCVVL